MVDNDTFKPGEIRFVDNYVPSLAAGNYTIQVAQKLTGGVAYKVDQYFTETQEFTVSGPRFRLDPSDVYAMFPPPNSQGIFDHDLPHVVLTRRSLPWERSLFDDKTIPWMALLLFDASEILPPAVGTNTGSEAPNPTGVTALSVQELVTPTQVEPATFRGAYDPALIDVSEMSQSCQVIDITPETFRTVMPSRDDIKYLAHCREVNQAPNNENRWYSVVVGGRFPSSPAAGQAGKINVAHLVSLEGVRNYLDGTGNVNFPAEIARIRLVSLASWTFTCLPEGGESFSELMLGLAGGDGKAALEFKLPTPLPVAGAPPEEEFSIRVLEAGYIPCCYQTRQGERTFAWYRGPFTPQPVKSFPPDCGPFVLSTEAMVYDQDHGLFDLSYAVARESGRLLALSDQRFGVALLHWRREAHRLIDRLLERGCQSGNQNDASDPQLIDTPPGPNTARDAFMSFLLGHFADTIEPQIFKPRNMTPTAGSVREEAPGTNTDLANQYQTNSAQQYLKQTGSEDLQLICDWLARLYLLHGVPFNNLVPEERLLPPESIRFFFLDRNWLEIMLDGALSIGIQSSRDIKLWDTLHAFIGEQVSERIPAKASEGPLAGLLLRSAVVSGWPGLEVRAYSNSDGKGGSGQVGLLRMDRLSENVLLCLFDQVPAWIEFNEPKEGLHFGVEAINDEEIINLRYWSDEKVGKLAEKTIIPGYDAHRKLNIMDLLDQIRFTPDLGGGNELGPAAFALQMVKTPEQMVFQRAVGRS